MHIDANQIIGWAFQAIMGTAATYGVTLLSKLRSSIDELNIKVAVVIEKTAYHEKELDKHSARIEKLEHLSD